MESEESVEKCLPDYSTLEEYSKVSICSHSLDLSHTFCLGSFWRDSEGYQVFQRSS